MQQPHLAQVTNALVASGEGARTCTLSCQPPLSDVAVLLHELLISVSAAVVQVRLFAKPHIAKLSCKHVIVACRWALTLTFQACFAGQGDESSQHVGLRVYVWPSGQYYWSDACELVFLPVGAAMCAAGIMQPRAQLRRSACTCETCA